LKNLVFSWTDPKGVVLPVYSDNTKHIKYLAAGQSVKVDYTVMADVNANPGLYTLNVNLSYEDSDSSAKSIKTTAGLFVGGSTDFDVSFSESSAGDTSLSIANVGNNIAYAVKVSIPDQDGYKVSGSPSTIVGNLEKGDYTIASFNITNTRAGYENSGTDPNTTNKRYAAVDNTSSSSMNSNPLKVQIEYTDAKGERITVDKDVVIQMSASTGFGTGDRTGTRDNRSSGLSSNLLYILGIVIVGAGVFLYRKRKKGAKKADDKTFSDDSSLGMSKY
jgi:LPXTG-motif cell wall-anchored protein